MEAYGRSYVAIDVQLLVNLLDGEDHRLPAIISYSGCLLADEALYFKRSNLT
jgi:hypothetical protein